MIGGGDWGEDRLLADAVRAVEAGRPLRVRNPDAVRPWQHVLSPLGGYLRLAQALWRGDGTPARAWNFGPRAGDERDRSAGSSSGSRELWDGALAGSSTRRRNPPEAAHLALDSSAAERELGLAPAVGPRRGAGADRRVAPGAPRGRGHARGEPRADRDRSRRAH